MIGIDLVKIERIEKAIASEHFLRRVFTALEIGYAQSKANPSRTFAGIFAAKEASVKALGCYLFDVEIVYDENGCPKAKAHGRTIPVSISHEKEYAIAVAINLIVAII